MAGQLGRLTRTVARHLPPARGAALERLGRDVRDLVTGRAGRTGQAGREPDPNDTLWVPPGLAETEIGRSSGTAAKPQLGRRIPPITGPWIEAPQVADAGRAVRSIYAPGETAERFDVELLEKLNAEYAERRIVTQAPKYDADSLATNAQRRAAWVHGMVDLRGKRTLEIGCGNGYELWSLAHNYDADAWGVDVTEYGPWDGLTDDQTRFVMADLARDNPFEANFFDRVISFTVWEHVLHPYALLAETYKVLKPGGVAWIRANLYAGPKASHRYRDIYFPWPHLLFTDEVVRDWDVKCGRRPIGHAWVNRLSWLHYRFYIESLGFTLLHLSFTETPLDEDFYLRFENILGRYPRWDLTKDYFLVILQKPLNG